MFNAFGLFRVLFLFCFFAAFSGCSNIRVEGQTTYYERVEALELMAEVAPQAGNPNAADDESEEAKKSQAEK
ncbi:MAG: hypothetical protein MI867_06845 [Pseudomonadales bacterium]|nr:hypothetical protein [Pseudomonadales bacterium]